MSNLPDSHILVCLQQAVVDTLKTQLSCNATVSAAIVQGPTARQADSAFEIISVMGIKSSRHIGSLAIAFPKETFLGILESMLGEKHTEISDKNSDASSEILNIIYASARAKINEGGFDFQPAIPSTICGSNIWLPAGQFNEFVRFDCSSDRGNFLLAFAVKLIK